MTRTTGTGSVSSGTSVVERICAAVNAHDLDALVDCFTDDYVNESPTHPARGFRGRAQVRRNWSQIFVSVPDVTATLLRCDETADRVWTEWEMRGTRLDGAPHLMRGAMLFTVSGHRVSAVRFYLEPVDTGDEDADQALVRTLGART